MPKNRSEIILLLILSRNTVLFLENPFKEKKIF